jgi:predicted ATPase
MRQDAPIPNGGVRLAIHSVTLGNFKGIAATQTLDIRPITIFVGANSSGKSSCLHALGALAQTVKVTNDSRPLVLDDEFALVHLGRFIEIVHSRSYDDPIELGIGLNKIEVLLASPGPKQTIHRVDANLTASYQFKCTKRTQEVYLEEARYSATGFATGEQPPSTNLTITLKRAKQGNYNIGTQLGQQHNSKCVGRLQSAFFLSGVDFARQEFFVTYVPVSSIQQAIKSELSKILYLGPFRQGPLRRYATRGSGPTEVGALGDSTITMLANETIQSRLRSHIKQVSTWLKHLGLANAIEVARVGNSDLFDVSMTLSDGSAFPLADLGYGLSQVLPVLVQCSFAPKGATLLFEQPEIHLHSIAATKLADVFAETANEREAHILLETHSPDLVKAFVQLLKKKKLKREDIAIYRVHREGGRTVTTPFEFDDEYDVYENWEKGLSVP